MLPHSPKSTKAFRFYPIIFLLGFISLAICVKVLPAANTDTDSGSGQLSVYLVSGISLSVYLCHLILANYTERVQDRAAMGTNGRPERPCRPLMLGEAADNNV